LADKTDGASTLDSVKARGSNGALRSQPSTIHLRFLVFQPIQRELRLKKVELRRMQPEEKDLRQRTKEFALQIIRLFSELPKTTEAQVLGKQVLRSGTSVGANYREVYRARSRAEWSEWDERHARQRREGSGS